MFGWTSKGGKLIPNQGFVDICPNELVKQSKCSCKKGCSTKICSCFKARLKCTDACKCGDSCENHDPSELSPYDGPEDSDSDSDD